ncbi:arginine N-succinyltransferase [Legionella israelensis]|uniref:arginine N-succinyltransferase n=1 Tax=Legionella israelensis TaxID=454 RepID=UPI00117F6ADB|nr:arginine N-succinyltransferase [Legionella israelensis]QDP72620.1 arginine N-succinyltransferase [Legionella israelensis]
MMLFRKAKTSDLSAIHQLAKQSGIGMTTLPKEKALLRKRLQWSEDSFQKKLQEPANEYYFFVLEDTQSSKVIGTSAIEACIGHDLPFYSYKLSRQSRICHSLNIRIDNEVLNLVNDNQGKTEICTLFLDSDYRHSGNGLLLSKSRFIFMANFPHRFSPVIIAEMRGVSDNQGRSPFWDALGDHFFHMSFAEADRLVLFTNKEFIADLMPTSPIFVKLLSQEAQKAIGKPHPNTVPAMNILLKEGFRNINYIDIFDAGPTIEAPLNDIKTVSLSEKVNIQNILDDVISKDYIVANTQLDFRATIGHVVHNKEQKTCLISKTTADLLQVQIGDSLRIVPLNINEST